MRKVVNCLLHFRAFVSLILFFLVISPQLPIFVYTPLLLVRLPSSLLSPTTPLLRFRPFFIVHFPSSSSSFPPQLPSSFHPFCSCVFFFSSSFSFPYKSPSSFFLFISPLVVSFFFLLSFSSYPCVFLSTFFFSLILTPPSCAQSFIGSLRPSASHTLVVCSFCGFLTTLVFVWVCTQCAQVAALMIGLKRYRHVTCLQVMIWCCFFFFARVVVPRGIAVVIVLRVVTISWKEGRDR